MEEVTTESSAPSGDAKDKRFWTPEKEDVLRRGLPDEPNAKGKAIDKLRALHPKLKKPKALEKRLSGIAPNGLAVWLTPEFWKREIDLTLIEGIYGGKKKLPQVVERIRTLWPELDGEDLLQRMKTLAAESQPAWFQKKFWKRLDPILLTGIRQGNVGERKVVDKVLRLHPELRIERVWSRVRDLRRQDRKPSEGIEPRAGPFPWTREQERRLTALCDEVGLREAASIVQRETGWPRDAIIRKAHKLGVPKKEYRKKQEWGEIDRTFLLASVRHLSVRKIARLLDRPVNAVWVQIWREGLPGAWDEGYSRRELCRRFHVSPATLRGWIHAQLLKDGAEGRIPERSVRAFLRQHPDLINWDRMDAEGRQWALDLSAKDEDAESDGAIEDGGGSAVTPSSAKQLAATAQT